MLISLNKLTIDSKQLHNFVLPETLTEYEKSTLQFCKDWMNGKTDFSIQTSGSTGSPKTIKINRDQMALSAEMTVDFLKLKKGDKSLVCLNTEYIAGKMMLVRSMEKGMDMTIVNPSSNPLTKLESKSFDFAAFVPLQLHAMLKENRDTIEILNNMKAIIVGGAPVNIELEEEIQKIKSPVFLSYGMTETVSHIALRRLNGKSRSPFYKTLKNIEINSDERGCLSIVSPLTNNELLITNDLVEIIDKNTFKWLGRIDNVINSGGMKIQPEKIEKEIEKIFFSQTLRNRFFICGVPDNILGEAVALVVEGNNFNTTVESKIIILLKEKVSKYELPKHFFYSQKFEETRTGKINRKLVIEKILSK